MPIRTSAHVAAVPRRHLTRLGLAAGLGLAMRAHAQTLYWDTNGATGGSGNAGGSWDTGTNWTTDSGGAIAPVGWTDGNAAIFSAGSDGTGAWTATITGTVDPNSITFAQNGSKTVSGGNITIGGGLALSSSGRSNSDTYTIGSKLTGTGSISIAANGDTSDTGGGTPGKFSLTNTANDFVGNVTITSGVVDFAGDGVFGNTANDIIIAGGGLVATSTKSLPATRDIVLSGGGDKIFRLYGGTTFTINGPISGTGNIRHTDGGTLVLAGANSFTGNVLALGGRTIALSGANTYNGVTHAQGGTIRLDANNTVPDNSAVVMWGGASTFNANGRTDTIGTLTTGSAGDTSATVNLGAGGNITVTNNNLPAGFTSGYSQATVHGSIIGTGSITYAHGSTFNGLWDIMNAGNSFTGNWTVTQGRLRMLPNAGADAALGNAANDLIFNGNPVTTLGNNEGRASFQVQNGTSFALGAGRDIVLNAGKEGTLYVWGATTMTVNGKITGGGILRKEDGGTLLLNNTTSDYTGETRLTQGTITLGASGVIPDASLLRFGSSGTLNMNGMTETVGGLSSVRPSDSALLTGTAINGGGTLIVNQSTTESFGGVISSATALTKSGSGTLILRSANTYTGATTVNGGTLAIGSGGSTSLSSPVTVNTGGIFRIDRNDTWGNHTAVTSPAITVNAGGTLASSGFFNTVVNPTLAGGTILLNGGANADYPAFALKGTVTVNGSTPSFITAGTGANNVISVGDVAAPGVTVFNVADVTGSAAADLTVTAAFKNNRNSGGTAENANGITKTGVGTMVMSGPSTYTGATTVNAGTLAAAGGSAVPNNSAVVVANASGATFRLDANEVVGSIQGGGGSGGTINLQSSTLTTGGNNASTVFDGQITGTGGSLAKTGTGTLTLSNSANDFSGKVTVSQGTLHLTGSSGTLGLGNPAAAGDAILLGGGTSAGTLRISNGNLTLAAGRGITLGGNGGVVEVDTARTLAVSTFLDADAVGSTFTKAGAGTFNLTADAAVNALVVAGGTYHQGAGQTQIFNTTTGLSIQNGGTYLLSGGTLKVDKITTTGTGAFVWGGGTLTARSTNGNLGTTDHTAAGYNSVRTGLTATIEGDVATGAGSVWAMHGSPTLYLNNGVRFNNWAIDGDLSLLDGSDTLEFELNPYFLRPFSSAGIGAIETGSLPLITWTGSFAAGGTFNNVTGIIPTGVGFTESLVPVTDPTALATDTWYIEYDTAAQTIWFHYKVSGYVPEPASFGMLAAGALGLRLTRTLANRRRRITALDAAQA